MKGKRILTIMAITSVIVQSVGVTAQAAEKKYNTNRLGGKNRIETSLNIASAFNNGKVDAVVVTTSVSFPDALTGSTLAAKYKAPLLLVNSTAKESKDSLDFIKNHLAENGKVYILGGTGVISQDIENAIRGMGYNDIKRLGGKNRMETSKIINKELGVTKGTPVFLVSSANFPDALSASSVAGIEGYPILLTNKDSLPEDTLEVLREIKPSKIYFVGGTGAISDKVVDEVGWKLIMDSISLIRLSGSNRYETSLGIAKYFRLNTNNAVLASGKNFPDALVGSSLAVKNNAPIILMDSDTVAQKEFLAESEINNLIVLGGEGSVSQAMLNSLYGIVTPDTGNSGKPVEIGTPEVKKDGKYTKIRFNTNNAYNIAAQMSNEFVKNNSIVSDGSVDVMDRFVKKNGNSNCIIIGDDDKSASLTSAPLSVYLNAPVLITNRNGLNAQTQAQLAKLKVKNVYIVGGEDRVSSTVEAKIKSLGYNVVRYGGSDDIETNRIVVKSIPTEVWGYAPKVVNTGDWVQGASVAIDTKCSYGLNNELYINPIILVKPTASTKEDIEEIAELVEPALQMWEAKQPKWFSIYTDDNMRDNMISSKFGPEDMTRPTIGEEINNVVRDFYSPIWDNSASLSSGYKKTDTFNNFSLNYRFVNNGVGFPYRLKGVMLCNVNDTQKSLAVPALSAKYAMYTVFGGKPIQELMGYAPDSGQLKDMFNDVYGDINRVYFVGNTSVLPEGSEKVLSGK